jgi:uncharacterized DUF497 family protein
MLKLAKYIGFDWDSGNVDKSYYKHGIAPNEAEEIFFDSKALIVEDNEHSRNELRYWIIGQTNNKKMLIVVFTIRGKKIRIISARKANKKEKERYEKV